MTNLALLTSVDSKVRFRLQWKIQFANQRSIVIFYRYQVLFPLAVKIVLA